MFHYLLQVWATKALLSARPHLQLWRQFHVTMDISPRCALRLVEQQYSPVTWLPTSEATAISSGAAPLWPEFVRRGADRMDMGNVPLRKGKVPCLTKET